MSKTQRWISSLIWGLFWAAVPVGVAWLPVRYSGELAAWILEAVGQAENIGADIPGILGQLKAAEVGLPWLWIPAAGLPFGALLRLTAKRPSARRGIVTLGILLFLPVVLCVLCMFRINGILLGRLVASFLPMLR